MNMTPERAAAMSPSDLMARAFGQVVRMDAMLNGAAWASAVGRLQDAFARFDAALGSITDPWPDRVHLRAVDWSEHREVTVPAEEAELEARFGRGTRSAGGGGELRGRRRIVKRDRPSANREPVRVNRAAERPREVMEMPKGKQGPSDEQLLEVAKTFSVSFTTDELLERLVKVHGKDAPGYETLHKRLAGMRKRGILTGGRGPGKGAPTVWSATGRDTKGRPAPGLLVSADAKKAKRTIDGYVFGEDVTRSGSLAKDIGTVRLGGAEIIVATRQAFDRFVDQRVAEALRMTADEVAARATKGAA